jgi:hypothetical protein
LLNPYPLVGQKLVIQPAVLMMQIPEKGPYNLEDIGYVIIIISFGIKVITELPVESLPVLLSGPEMNRAHLQGDINFQAMTLASGKCG